MQKILQLAFIVASFGMSTGAHAQVDPRPALGTIIAAFQQCGPPQAYQLLSPQLFNVVYQQTGGTGCYGPISAAGPVTNMQVLQSQQFPIGPLFLVRVTHVSGPVDWFIGLNQFTGRIEYLSFQAAQGGVSIDTGPGPTASGPGNGSPSDSGSDDDRTGNGGSDGRAGGGASQPDGCDLYPAMCQ